MSASPLFTEFLQQPGVPLPWVPPPIPSWLSGQPTEQPKPSAGTAAIRFVQWRTRSQQASGYLSPREGQGAYVVEYHAILDAIDERLRLLERSKPPERAHEFQHFPWGAPNREARRDLGLNELERAYVFEGRSAVGAFIARRRLHELLLEAREPLNAAFGVEAVKKLTLVEDDEGFTTLFCLILVPGDMAAARLALNSFDMHWWLARSGQAGGKLNFDFELIRCHLTGMTS